MHNKLFYLILVVLFACQFSAEGQKLVNSPYSRFNLGRLEQQGSFRSAGMGGISTALRDNNSIQFTNPASYSSFDTLSFIFDIGMDYSKSYLSNGGSSYHSDDMNFHHLMIGFPITKGFGVAAGVVPYSNGYYDLFEQVKVGDTNYDPLTGEYSQLHKGTGSYNTFFLGTGLNITKDISVGLNLTVLFGQIEKLNQVNLLSDNYLFSSKYNEKLSLRGINFDYGIQYHTILKNEYFFTAGISYTMGKDYRSNYEKYNIRYSNFYFPTLSPDTITYETNKTRKVFLPQTIRTGITFGKKNLIMAGIDYVFSNWADATIPESEGYIANSKSLRMGIEYTPKKGSNSSYLNNIDFRLGGHIANNYLVINGHQLKESGFTFGFGLPMLRTISKTNLYFDYTNRHGSADSGFPRENVYSVGVSFNLHDAYWFIKSKYN
jgi:hypothetical protein